MHTHWHDIDQLAATAVRLLVIVLALAPWPDAAQAQDTYPEVTVRLVSESFSLGEGLSRGITVNLDRVPEREVWVDWEVTHYGGATAADYWFFPSYFYFPANRRVQFVIVTARNDDLDDDCESVEISIVPRSSGVVGGGKLTISIRDDDGETVDCTDIGPAPPPAEPEPKPKPEPEPEPEPVCPHRLTPYWHGSGGFAVRPADGESATVRIECAGRSYTSRERAGEDGLIVRTVSQPICTADDGRAIEGEMTFEGIDGDGWYWINGDRNVAVAPLVCEESLNPGLRPPVPGGVTARPSGDRRFVLSVRGEWHGTLMVHEESGFMGIVPHLVDLEGDGEHVAPYWKGGGGIVGRPLDGSRATVRLACGEADTESQVLEAGEDGLIVELLPGCFDEDGAAVAGRLEVDGLEDGAWYWLNTGPASAAAPLLRRGAEVNLTTPVLPAGVDAEEGPLGTLFSRGPLMGVVPRVERVKDREQN